MWYLVEQEVAVLAERSAHFRSLLSTPLLIIMNFFDGQGCRGARGVRTGVNLSETQNPTVSDNRRAAQKERGARNDKDTFIRNSTGLSLFFFPNSLATWPTTYDSDTPCNEIERRRVRFLRIVIIATNKQVNKKVCLLFFFEEIYRVKIQHACYHMKGTNAEGRACH